MNKKIIKFVFILGLLFLLIGFYYFVIKAGIPYQDPPKELLEQYNKNKNFGEFLVRIGLLIELCGLLMAILSAMLKSLEKQKSKINKNSKTKHKDKIFKT